MIDLEALAAWLDRQELPGAGERPEVNGKQPFFGPRLN